MLTPRSPCGPLAAAATALALAVLSAACAHDYVYAPVTNTGATMNGRAAADYAIPPELPKGDVRIASLGFADLTPDEAHAGEDIRAIHVREIVANESQATWTVDTREQRVALASAGESRPAYASADAAGHGTAPPVVTIPPGGKRTIDLFFPAPDRLAHAAKLPEFDVIWTVKTDTRAVSTRTPFERIELVPAYRPVDDYPYGPYWYDPDYPGRMFIGVGPRVYVPAHPVVRVHGGFHGGGPIQHRR